MAEQRWLVTIANIADDCNVGIRKAEGRRTDSEADFCMALVGGLQTGLPPDVQASFQNPVPEFAV